MLDARLDERGFIRNLASRQHGTFDGDLFIDCSGFHGLLINRTLGEPFISYAKYLPCDRAVAMQVTYSEDSARRIDPYTTATALGSGWVWNTPLSTRSGNGYVYASDFIDPGEAEAELRRHLGERAAGLEARHLKMRVGKTRMPWVKNCVSIGLSSGFVEPLESTGIFLIETALEHLLHNFPTKRCHPAIAANFNRLMAEQYDEIRDFLVMHYCLTQRDDTPFWKSNKHHEHIPDRLQQRLELWREIWPNNKVALGPLFPDYSYTCILAGMGVFPKHPLPALTYRDPAVCGQTLDAVRQDADRLVSVLPDHEEFLQVLRLRRLLRVWGAAEERAAPTAS